MLRYKALNFITIIIFVLGHRCSLWQSVNWTDATLRNSTQDIVVHYVPNFSFLCFSPKLPRMQLRVATIPFFGKNFLVQKIAVENGVLKTNMNTRNYPTDQYLFSIPLRYMGCADEIIWRYQRRMQYQTQSGTSLHRSTWKTFYHNNETKEKTLQVRRSKWNSKT